VSGKNHFRPKKNRLKLHCICRKVTIRRESIHMSYMKYRVCVCLLFIPKVDFYEFGGIQIILNTLGIWAGVHKVPHELYNASLNG